MNPDLTILGLGITNSPPLIAMPICCCIFPDMNGAPEDAPRIPL